MILILSEFQPTTNFGMLTSIGLWAALLFDLLLLPALIMLIVLIKQQRNRNDAAAL
jgi:predicted RND superfamily exporter protein